MTAAPAGAGIPARAHAARQRALLAWFDRHRRDLPWRRTRDPYAIWVSEIMLQQTRVETVIPYYERFLQAFPTVAALAAAPLDDVLRLWAGLGYYSRARNLHRAAGELAGTRLPGDAAGWRALPGVGRYVAAAVASIAHGAAVAALDGNIKRVFARWAAIDTPIDDRDTEERLWALADDWLDHARPGDWNQALMELGATVCTPRAPQCLTCPVRRWCRSLATGQAERLPRRSAKRPVPQVRAVAARIERRGRLLLVQRPAKGLLGGLWELPGGLLDGTDEAPQALARILGEDFGLAATVGRRLGQATHAFTHRRMTIDVFVASATARTRPRPRRHAAAGWYAPADLSGLALATVDRKVLLASGLAPAEDTS